MATLPNANPTLLDWTNRLDPDGRIAAVAELQNQTNEVLDDMTFIEGNLATGHRTTVRTGLPPVIWRKLYQGVPEGKSTTAQVTDNIGMIEGYSTIDKKLAALNGMSPEFRLSEAKPFIESMNQTHAQGLFYQNEAIAPEAITGFSPRFSTVSAATAPNADNVIDAGGTTNGQQASIWLVGWSPETVFGFFGKGSKAGYEIQDLGEQTVLDASGNPFQAVRTHFSWETGLCVKDWRYVVRICNIDVVALNTLANTKNLVQWMTQAAERMIMAGVRPAFYMPRNIREKLRLGVIEKTSSQLSIDNVAGRKVVSFDGIPVRRVDQLLLTENRVV